jgi:hypothetical protein
VCVCVCVYVYICVGVGVGVCVYVCVGVCVYLRKPDVGLGKRDCGATGAHIHAAPVIGRLLSTLQGLVPFKLCVCECVCVCVRERV